MLEVKGACPGLCPDICESGSCLDLQSVIRFPRSMNNPSYVVAGDERHSLCNLKGTRWRIASKCPSVVTKTAPVWRAVNAKRMSFCRRLNPISSWCGNILGNNRPASYQHCRQEGGSMGTNCLINRSTTLRGRVETTRRSSLATTGDRRTGMPLAC
jgi:hypothetical protein